MTVISRAWIGLVLAMGANAAVAAGADPAPGPAPAAAPGAAAPSPPTGGSAADEELRNTVINILDALVQKGILTRDQAQALVADAQAKAAAAAKQKAEQQAATVEAEKNAVHVQYVPQVVRDQIEADVGSQVSKDVTQKVVQQAKTEGWGVPGALPDWIRNVRLYGDVRVRGEYDSYASGNAENSYLNYQAINTAGGIAKAGPNALLNTTESRPYLFGRLRFGALVHLGDSLSADFRVTSGSGVNPISENQNLGDYANRWAVGVDRAALLWNPHSKSWKEDVDVRFGRFENPFVTNSEFIWDVDVAFEGLSATWNWNRVRGWDERTSRWLFVTVGAFPMLKSSQTYGFESQDKWLFGGQIGTEVPIGWDSKVRFAGAYYDFEDITGVRNAPLSNLTDNTAPAWLTKGNTLFDIRNTPDPTQNLFALAGKYRLVSALMQWDLATYGRNHVLVSGEYVNNVAWKSEDVLMRTGLNVPARTHGYDVGVIVGDPVVKAWGDWRAGISYRFLERDAVLDAFTDSDFHLGGTDAKGYILVADFGIARSAFVRVRYLSASQIDAAPLGTDVLQLDVTGQW